MALLKNLQEKYSTHGDRRATKLKYGNLAGLQDVVEDEGQESTDGRRSDLEPGPASASTSASASAARQPQKTRQRRRQNQPADGVDDRKVDGYRPNRLDALVARLMHAIGFGIEGLDKSSPPGTSPSVKVLQEKNRMLADRLEQLEDRSWEVRESEEIHRSLSEAFGDVVIHRNSDGDLIFRNNIFDEYFNGDQAPDLPVPKQSAATLTAATQEIELETLKGTRWFSWTDLTVRDSQTGEVGLRSVARDITQQKTSEQEILAALLRAEQANAAKSRFLAMVSHEIRTPLNGIIGMAGLLTDGSLAADQKNYVGAITSSGQTLLNLIEDLLDTARIESGNVELTLRETNLRRLVEDVAEIIAPVAREKGLELATFVERDIAPSLLLDSGRLRQILLNLVGNAVKFTKSGGVGVEVELHEHSDTRDRQKLTVSVRDSGPGLAEADQQRIFEEFVQTDEGATRQFGGAGLGLAISKNLVELMGGNIVVSSKLGRGTVFSFEIDVELAIPDSHSDQNLESIDQQVAVVMARTPARRAFVHSLRGWGTRVSTFDSLAALQLNHNADHCFDVVIAPFTDWDLADIHCLRADLHQSTRLINISDSTVTEWSGADTGPKLDAWLTRPVRNQSLYRVLTNQLEVNSTTHQQSQPNRPNCNPLKLLLAEDNPINALLAKSLLVKLGHEVVHVEDGEQALEAVESQDFDLVLMDLHMPVMDGMTAVRKIRALDCAWGSARAQLPIIVLSADGQDDVKQKALDLGADDFLLKPIDPDKLADVLMDYAGQPTSSI